MSDDSQAPAISRRQILRGVAAGAAVGGLGAAAGCQYGTQLYLLSSPPKSVAQRPEWSSSRVTSFRPLGQTGFSMSDVSFGCSGLSEPGVARRAIDKGVNYFDTSPDYSHAESERALGAAIRGVPRDQLFLVSKFCTPAGHLPNRTPVAEVIAAVEASLQRLGTDYLDLAHIHAVDDLDRLMAPNIHEAFDRLKQQGKLRYLGVSSHTPNLEAVMSHAVDCGRFDVIMVAYNFRNWPDLTEIFARARSRGVGVVAMKTLKGAAHTQLSDFTPSERESFAQAAFKWVLSNDDVSGLVVSMSRYEQVDEYLYASRGRPSESDLALLEKYDRLVAHSYCRPGCGDCLDACPYGVPVNDVLRYDMYARAYGREKSAMLAYARIDAERRADRCADCAAPCEDRCDWGIPIRQRLEAADRLLRWG